MNASGITFRQMDPPKTEKKLYGGTSCLCSKAASVGCEVLEFSDREQMTTCYNTVLQRKYRVVSAPGLRLRRQRDASDNL